MYVQIKSKVWDIVQTAKREIIKPVYKEDKFGNKKDAFIENNYFISLEEIEYIANIEEFKKICCKILEEDDDAHAVFLEMMEGKQNIGISESLGLEVRDVENIKKRIHNRLNKEIHNYYKTGGWL